MKFAISYGIASLGVDPDHMVAYVRHAEACGFEALYMPEHVAPYGVTTLPVHVGGSSRAAARRAGQRGDGYFPGGMLSPQERATQLDLARSEAAAAGRDPGALEYTRWASISMTRERAEALAAEGVTRVVVNVTSTDHAEQQDEMSALAERFELVGATRNARDARR